MSIRRILEALSGHDYRVTWQRWAVAAHIALKGDRLFTVDELYRSLKEHYPDIGLTTVYRTLDLLVDLGVIDRIPMEDGQAKYGMRRPDQESRQELVCETCGSTWETDAGQLQPLLKAAADREGFSVTRFELKVFGQCARCRLEQAPDRTARRPHGPTESG